MSGSDDNGGLIDDVIEDDRIVYGGMVTVMEQMWTLKGKVVFEL